MADTCALSQQPSAEMNIENGKDTVIRIAKDRIYELSNELFLMKSLYAKLEQQNKDLQKQVLHLKSDNEVLHDKLEWFNIYYSSLKEGVRGNHGFPLVDNALIPYDLLPLEPPHNISLNRCWCIDLSNMSQ